MNRIVILLTGACSFALAGGAVAQTTPSDAASAVPSVPGNSTTNAAPAAQPPDAGAGGLQDIVVTARRSAESLQNVPVAVTAFSGAFLDRQNVRDATAIPLLAPNITLAQQPGSISAAAVFIRGIGNSEPSAVSEQGVGIYLDGIYLARTAGAVFDLLDLERVEVLRGPQGTTFGRNTIGGAIQLVSRKPTDDFHAEAKAGYGRYNDWFVRGRVDTGYIGHSNIKISLAGQHRQADGYVNNLLASSRNDPGSLRGDTAAAAVEGDFGDLKVNYNFDYDEKHGTVGFFQVDNARADVAGYFGQSPNFGGDPFLVNTTRQQNVLQAPYSGVGATPGFSSTTRNWGHALTLSYEVAPALTLKSITGYRKFYQNANNQLSGEGVLRGQVITFGPTGTAGLTVARVYPFEDHNFPQHQHQVSQEFQALGSSGDFSYFAGLYYFHEHASEDNHQSLTLPIPIGLLSLYGLPATAAGQILAANPTLTGNSLVGLNLFPHQVFSGSSTSKAVFGQLSWKPDFLDQKLEITGGIRYTKDNKSVTLAGDVNPEQSGSVQFDNVSWLASGSYHVNRDILAYVRVSTGYRSGGIDPRLTFINSFRPEKATAYEAGIKSELFDHRLRFNLAGYITDYDDLQIQQFAAGSSGALTVTANAGKVRIKGFEAETTLTPVRNLVFDGSVGYTDYKYKEFLFRDPYTSVISDVSGIAKPVYAPKWTLHVGGEYSQQLAVGLARLRLDYSHRSTIYYNALNLTTPFNENIRSRPDDNLKARLSLEDVSVGGSKVTFGVWGDNLTNQKNIAYSIDFGALGYAGSIFKKPISYGVDAEVKF